jgi:predicted nuclease of predicted toxin-antitoxin system
MWREFEEPFETLATGQVDGYAQAGNEDALSALRFYADENFPVRAVDLLRSTGAQVQSARDIGLVGQPGETHADHALAHGLVLLTCDPCFLDEQRFPLAFCPAVFVFQFGSGTVRDMRRALRCLAPVLAGPGSSRIHCKVEAESDAWIEHYHRPNGLRVRACRRLWRGKMQKWVAVSPTSSSSC